MFLAGYSRQGRQHAARKGGAAVETAILAPFLGLLFLVAVDFGRLFYYQTTIIGCARNGAQFGSNLRSYQESAWVNPCTDATSAAVAAGSGLNPPLSSSQVSVTNGTGSDGNTNVVVTVTYPFTTVTPMMGFPSSYTLQATVKMRVAP